MKSLFKDDKLKRIKMLEEQVFSRPTKEVEFLFGYPLFTREASIRERVDNMEKEQNRMKLLAKHFGLEYYKYEVRETNGEIKNYIKEGFRKIKAKTK